MENDFDWNQFSIGFWHPFGPHGGETPEEVLDRKEKEILDHGWTLWSFQQRRPETLELWLSALKDVQGQPVFVFCSDSPGAVDPQDKLSQEQIAVNRMKEYRASTSHDWSAIPAAITVPHPGKPVATAFKVRATHRIQHKIRQSGLTIEWLEKSGIWRSDIFLTGLHYPNRGETLIRRRNDSQARLRPVKAVLELEPPFVVVLKR
jgi:hypothetical protein